MPLPVPQDVPSEVFRLYSIPLGVIGVVGAFFAIASTLYYSLRAAQRESRLNRITTSVHCGAVIASAILCLATTVTTYRKVQGQHNAYTLAVLTIIGTLLKQVSVLLCMVVPKRYTWFPGSMVDISNVFHYCYGVLYESQISVVFTIRITDSHLSSSRTASLKLAGRIICYLGGATQFFVLAAWLTHAFVGRKWSIWTLAGARCVAAVGALATYSVGLIGLALATGNVWGVSDAQGKAIKYAFLVGSALLTLLVPGVEVKDVIVEYSEVDTKA